MFKKKFFAKALAFAMVMGSVGIHGLAVAPVGIVKAAADEIICPIYLQTIHAKTFCTQCLQVDCNLIVLGCICTNMEL